MPDLDFLWIGVGVVVIVGLVYVWRSGMLGKDVEDKIKARRDAEIDKLQEKLKAKLAEARAEIPTLYDKVTPQPTTSAEVPQAPTQDMLSALTRLKTAHEAGLIDDKDYAGAKAALLSKELGLS